MIIPAGISSELSAIAIDMAIPKGLSALPHVSNEIANVFLLFEADIESVDRTVVARENFIACIFDRSEAEKWVLNPNPSSSRRVVELANTVVLVWSKKE